MKESIIIMTFAILIASLPLYAKQDTSDAAAKLAKQISNGMEEKKANKIALMPFSDIRGEESDLGKLLAEELTTRLFEAKKFEVVERSMLSKVMEENKLSMSGIVDAATAKQLGKILGVDAICTGTMTAVGDVIKINARLIMADTGSIASAASAEIDIDDSIRPLLSKNMNAGREVQRSLPGPQGQNRQVPRNPSGPENLPFPEGIPPIEEVFKFIESGGNIENHFGERGSTPLHIAAMFGNIDLMRMLVEKRKANVNARDNTPGASPLHDAVGFRRIEMVKYLIDHGADVNAKDSSGTTPLRIAARNGYLRIADMLIKRGARDEGPGSTAGNEPGPRPPMQQRPPR